MGKIKELDILIQEHNCTCRKVQARIECVPCGYPYSESLYSDMGITCVCICNKKETKRV